MQAAQAKNRWIDTSPEDWTLSLAEELLSVLKDDDQFKIDAVQGTRALDSSTQLALLDAAVSSTEHVLSQSLSSTSGNTALLLARNAASDESSVEQLRRLLEEDELVKQLLQQRLQLFDLHDKTRTWQEIHGNGASPVASGSGTSSSHKVAHAPADTRQDDDGDMQEDNDVEESWQFDEDDDHAESNDHQSVQEAMDIDPMDQLESNTSKLPDFLDTPILDIAYSAAASNHIQDLRTLFKRHARDLNPFRLDILDTIPLFSDVVEYIDLLPLFDTRNDTETEQNGEAWRAGTTDWAAELLLYDLLGMTKPTWKPSTAQQLAGWYKSRVEELDEATGQVDNALSLVQYGAAQGLPGLDALGEQLSLLSRLVYDRRSANSDFAIQQAWSLKKWQQSSESDIVDAYLSQSTPETIVQDIRGQVLPYLYVLESQRERAGQPDPFLHDTLLFEWMMRYAGQVKAENLDTIAAIFEASKPTLPASQRIIKSNEDLARLALACCYGHPGSASADIQAMLRVFDCLPSFDDIQSTSSVSYTLLSIVKPEPSSHLPNTPLPPTAFFKHLRSWDATALSKALDTLDLHLEAAEIFQRWNTPVNLQFFITLSADEKAQRLWADRLAKTSPAAVSKSDSQGRIGKDFEDEDEWISLLDDLCKLGAKSNSSENAAKPAFSALSQQEITKIFFSGLLSSASE